MEETKENTYTAKEVAFLLTKTMLNFLIASGNTVGKENIKQAYDVNYANTSDPSFKDALIAGLTKFEEELESPDEKKSNIILI